MDSGPRSYRLNALLEKISKHLHKTGANGVLVTTSDGVLHGYLRRADVEKALSGRGDAG
jgi:histidinol phosphatase-like enzyme